MDWNRINLILKLTGAGLNGWLFLCGMKLSASDTVDWKIQPPVLSDHFNGIALSGITHLLSADYIETGDDQLGFYLCIPTTRTFHPNQRLIFFGKCCLVRQGVIFSSFSYTIPTCPMQWRVGTVMEMEAGRWEIIEQPRPLKILLMKSVRKAILVVVSVMALLASCDEGDVSNPLSGSWTLKGTTIQNCKDESQNTSTTYFCDASSCRNYTFNPDGTLRVDVREGTITATTNGTYTISDSNVVIHIDTQPHSISGETFTFTLSGSTLYLKEIITDLSGKCSATIVLGN